MDVDIESYLIFEEIKDVPECNRLIAVKRYFVIKAYEHFLDEEAERLRSKFRRKAATKIFCDDHGLKLRTLYRWYSAYKEKGLRGLVSNFGNRRKTPEKKRTIASIPPSVNSISANIKIDRKNPLLALYQINFLVQQVPAFSEKVREYTARLLDELDLAEDGMRKMSLARALTKKERKILQEYITGTHRRNHTRALALQMMDQGCYLQEIMFKTKHSRRTIIRWKQRFKDEGLSFIETKIDPPEWQEKRHKEKIRVLDILHSPPMTFDINRTNWTHPSIIEAYEKKYGEHLAKGALQRIIKEANYSWHRARTMLTSKDPLYREKVKRLIDALQSLTPSDAFFFIDEAGPWRVKKYGGRVLTAPGERRTLPEYQPDRGAVYLIAALEAQTNQVVYQFIKGKTAKALVNMLQELMDRYSAYSRICLTWDSLSSHNAKLVNDWISDANATAKRHRTAKVEVYPLPSNAQFLNVVESTFRNIRKAVIYNSDYPSVEEMQAAITRYLNERNAYFLLNPRRAGNKIWSKELFTPEDLPGGLYRKM